MYVFYVLHVFQVSPLISVCVGGIVYDETWYYGFPIITNMRTVDGVPYDEWPDLVKVVANSVVGTNNNNNNNNAYYNSTNKNRWNF